jgi:hypothetical protein
MRASMGNVAIALGLAVGLQGCVTGSTDVVKFTPRSPQQQAMVRDGASVITSRGRLSVVTLRPATRLVENGRPVFIVNIQNQSKATLTFRTSQVSARQSLGGAARDLKVFSYEELVQEEKNAQVGRAIGVALVAGANSYSAGRSYWRQARADDQNAELTANVAAAGARNLEALEALAIKDNTLLPGETYGGRLVIQGPETGDMPSRSYTLVLPVGADVHEFTISQGPAT